MDPDFRLPGQIRHGGLKNRPEIIGDDDVIGIGDVDAVGQRQPDQFGIDECRDAADPGDTEPGGDVIRPARHQQANGIAGFNPRRQRPARVLIDPAGQSPVTEGLRF